jgi:hypothetical protein
VSPWRFSRGDFGLKPYRSVDENFALRGLGLEAEVGGLRVCGALSRTRLDASLDDADRVKSLPSSGYHSSPSGRAGKDALTEDLLGLTARYSKSGFSMACCLAYSEFDRAFSPDFRGLRSAGNTLSGIDLVVEGEGRMVFLEAATSGHADVAAIGGLAIEGKRMEVMVLGRMYDREFVAVHARPFAFYSGLGTGERGLMTLLEVRPAAGTSISMGNDLHQKRPPRSGVARPAGTETFLDLEHRRGRLTTTLAGKLLTSEEPPRAEGDPTERRSRMRSRMDLRYEVPGGLWGRLRYEGLAFRREEGKEVESSWSDLFRLDLGYRFGRAARFTTGAYVFSVPDYGARLYQYEAGLPYYPSLEMLKTDGARWYIVLSARSGRWGQLAGKLAETVYRDAGDRFEYLLYYTVRM